MITILIQWVVLVLRVIRMEKKSLKVYMIQAIKKYYHIRLMPNPKKNVKISFVQDKLASSIELS